MDRFYSRRKLFEGGILTIAAGRGRASVTSSPRVGWYVVKVSVIVPAFCLEKYVGDCVESLASQVTDFDFEVIALDDASRDGTPDILNDLETQHERLRVLRNARNLGLAGTMSRLLGEARGAYIAYVDGDDLAFPGKLQALADHLDEHADCAIAYHEAEVFHESGERPSYLYSRDHYNAAYVSDSATVEDLIRYGCFMNASSVMLRRHAHLQNTVDAGCKILLDYPFQILNACYLRGSLDRVGRVLGAYRLHEQSYGGQTKRSAARRLQVLADQERACENAAPFGVSPMTIAEGKAHHRFAAALYFLKAREFGHFRRCITDASADGFFFDERQKFAWINRDDAPRVYEELYELCA